MKPELHPFAVAKLLSDNAGLSQDAIAKTIGTTQPSVSRIVRELEDSGDLRKQWRVSPEFRSQPDWAEMEEELAQLRGVSDLQQQIARRSPYRKQFLLKIVEINDEDSKSAPYDFGRAAAPIVAELIAPLSRIGVSCGKTIEGVIRGMAPGEVPRAKDKQIIPVLAEPAFLRNTEQSHSYSATHMAELLQTVYFGEAQDGVPVLRGVIAYLPRRFRQRPEFKQFIEEMSGYRSIFLGDEERDQPPLINKLECILTGAGAVSPDKPDRQGTLIRERLKQEDHPSVAPKDRIKAAQLEKIIHGDLSGILIPKAGLKDRDKELVDELNDGLMGLKLSHFERVCERVVATEGSTSRSPGVILAAFGEQKLGLTAACIKEGYVTTLVTTKRSALQLIEVIESGK